METRQDGASAAGPRECWVMFMHGHGVACSENEQEGWVPMREVVQESQPSTAPASQGELTWTLELVPPMDILTISTTGKVKVNSDATREQLAGTLEQAGRYIHQIGGVPIGGAKPPADPSQGMRGAVESPALRELKYAMCDAYGLPVMSDPKQVRVAEALAALSRSQDTAAPTVKCLYCGKVSDLGRGAVVYEAPAKEGGDRG